VESGWLLPDLSSEVTRGFWEGCAEGELRIQTCGDCGRMRMPPRPMCPTCRSIERDWAGVSGRGRIWSFVIPHPPLLPAYAEIAPYAVATVELVEDPALRVVGALVAGPGRDMKGVRLESVEIGDEVEVAFIEVEDVVLPCWTSTKWI
jgi:uncharacterized OB-fold protein